ncbi:MAG: tetratricopeptide repeat protein [Planctomycetota bacterium]|jgi:tetratricopeptide (TPR) repeat protein
MTKWVYFMTLFAGAAVCIGLILLNARMATESSSTGRELERSEKTVGTLEDQLREAKSQANASNRKIELLEQEVAALTEQRTSDRQVLQDLWEMVLNNTRAKATLPPAEQQAIEQAREQIAREAEQEEALTYDVDAIKEIISAGGGLDAAVKQIVTPDRVASTLEAHSEHPAYWAAAATLAEDPNGAIAYLEEAAKLYPDSKVVLSSLVEARIAHGTIDESLMAQIDEMKRVDPANALADCYAAVSQFKSGDIDGALQSLSQAGAKDRFADDRMDLLMARYDYFLEGGATEGMAIGLSAFELPLSHMGMLREMEKQSMLQAGDLVAAGQLDEALQIAQDVSNIGGSLSSSGRFIIYDRVGMAMQKSALQQQRQIYEGRGDTSQVEKIDVQLQAIDERSAMIDVMAQTFGGVMANMTEQDIAAYVDGTVLNGEFSLAEAQEARAAQTEQITPP